MISGFTRQETIYSDGVFGRKPLVPTNFSTLKRDAKQVMSKKAWAYIAGAAGDSATLNTNHRDLDELQIIPKMLINASSRSLETNVLGMKLESPLMLSPIGAGGLVHPRSDILAAKAAAQEGIPYIISSQASSSMEDIAKAMDEVNPDSIKLFQLYWSKDDRLVKSFINRAEKINAKAIILTLDTTHLGWRPMDLNLGSLPFTQGIGISQYTSDKVFWEIVEKRIKDKDLNDVKISITLDAIKTLFNQSKNIPGGFFKNLISNKPKAAVQTFLDIYSRPELNWDDISRLKEYTNLPIVLKGILNPEDAKKASDTGVDAILVSNHGGRQVDGSISSINALANITKATKTETSVWFDSGIRSGSDVFKALAVGADVVCVGRPYMYGLAIAGQEGVREVIQNILAELDLTMALTGVTSLDQLSKDYLLGVK